jgi:hypothetical protein
VRRFRCKFLVPVRWEVKVANARCRISGVGVRKYYAKLGYYLDGPYMSKDLKPLDDDDESDEE